MGNCKINLFLYFKPTLLSWMIESGLPGLEFDYVHLKLRQIEENASPNNPTESVNSLSEDKGFVRR